MRSASVCLVLLALCAPPVRAQDATPAEVEAMSEDERFELAKKLFEQGKLAYDLGKFEDAVTHFERAHALRPAPLLLFNLGQSHRHLGHWEEASHLYQGFLREAPPDAVQRELAEQMLAEMQQKLEELRAREQAAAEADATAQAAAATESTAAASAEVPDETEEDAEDGLGTRLLWGGVVAGAAVVAAAAALTTVAILATPPAPGDGGTLDLR